MITFSNKRTLTTIFVIVFTLIGCSGPHNQELEGSGRFHYIIETFENQLPPLILRRMSNLFEKM
jgi:hypothetical protein